jgi:hypothetical protein
MGRGGGHPRARRLGQGCGLGSEHWASGDVHCLGITGECFRRHVFADIQDKTVLIHTRPSPTSPWTSTQLLPSAPDSKDPHFPDAVWRVSWSLAGNILAVSCGDGKVSLWKEGVGRGWECVSDFSS